MTRLLALTFGIAIAAAAFFTLSTDRAGRSIASGPPLDEIDDASRARLERVLRDPGDPGN